MTDALRRDQLGTLHQVMRQFGDVARITAGPPGLRRTFYLVSHPDAVARVLGGGESEYAKDNPTYREIAWYLGDGLLTSSGERWRRQRRTAAPLFTRHRIDSYVEVMVAEAERLIERWSATDGTVRVDLYGAMTEYALRVVGRTLFGTDVERAIPVVQSVLPPLSRHIRSRGLNPLRPPRHWPTPGLRRAQAYQNALYRVVDDVIDSSRGGSGGGTGLVSRLLEARDPDSGDHLSRQDVRDQLLIFLLAGFETTATTLTLALYLLGRYPAWQERIRAEADEVIGARNPTAADLRRLEYTTMAVNEALRLYPPAYGFGRTSLRGDVIGGHRLPPGARVLLCPWVTHRHPDFWPDPERFDPGRFDTSRSTVAGVGRHRYAYFPFGGGPHVCIGSHFATTEAITAVAMILVRYSVQVAPTPLPLRTGLTLQPTGPVLAELIAVR